MTIKVGINGTGTIGRLIAKIIWKYFPEFELRAVNDPNMTTEELAYLMRYDTNHGYLAPEFAEALDGKLVLNGKAITHFKVSEIKDIRWADVGVELVFECSGALDSSEIQDHMRGGAKRILVCYPLDNSVPIAIAGLNMKSLNQIEVFSTNSCSTQPLAFVSHALNEEFGVEAAVVRLIRSYTNDQLLIDNPKKQLERGRAAAENIVPTSTSAGKMVGWIIPPLHGRILNGVSYRVPTSVGRVVEVTTVLSYLKEGTVKEVNKALENWCNSTFKGYLKYTEDELVSSDVTLEKYLDVVGVILGRRTQCIPLGDGRHMVTVSVLYDNEAQFAYQAIRTASELFDSVWYY